MTRHVLRKGFSVEEAPGGVGHLIDSRTGDALVLSPAEFALLSGAGTAGVDAEAKGVPELLARCGPFFVEADVAAAHGFYELDIEDAPTALDFPSVAPVLPVPASPPAATSFPRGRAAAPSEAATWTSFPSLEVGLQGALEASTQLAPEARPTEEIPVVERGLPTVEVPLPAAAAGPVPSREEAPPQGLESAALREEIGAAAVASRLVAPAAPLTGAPPPARPSRRPLLLTVVGVALLALGVAATFALRPGGEGAPPPGETPLPPKPAVVEASAALPLPAVGPPQEPTDAGSVELDAGAPAPQPDAGSVVTPPPPEVEGAPWLVADLQGRGRVKMGEVKAAAAGELTWEVADGQRVKAKQALGTVASAPLHAPSVGLAIFKQPSGATVKRGTVLAEIIYFQAWARGVVQGATPTTSWRCEVASAAAQQRADCKISVVAPRAGGAQVTVAVEPRWFDTATDAVLRLAP